VWCSGQRSSKKVVPSWRQLNNRLELVHSARSLRMQNQTKPKVEQFHFPFSHATTQRSSSSRFSVVNPRVKDSSSFSCLPWQCYVGLGFNNSSLPPTLTCTWVWCYAYVRMRTGYANVYLCNQARDETLDEPTRDSKMDKITVPIHTAVHCTALPPAMSDKTSLPYAVHGPKFGHRSLVPCPKWCYGHPVLKKSVRIFANAFTALQDAFYFSILW
jgi:hypothetical protein